MRLVECRIENYRSVNDSGPIRISQRTALVGRNESGKSNLLLALASFKPPGGLQPLSRVKDFPRDRPRSEFSEDLDVVHTTWNLSQPEQAHLGEIFPRAKDVTHVSIRRRYKGTGWIVEFEGLPAVGVDGALVSSVLARVRRSILSSIKNRDDITSAAGKDALDVLSEGMLEDEDPDAWSEAAPQLIESFRVSLRNARITPTEHASACLEELEAHAASIRDDEVLWKSARQWAIGRLPVFIYLSDYPELPGHQNVPEYLERIENKTPTEADTNFAKLMKVAKLNPQELHDLLEEEPEERQLLANRAGAAVTRTVQDLWTDRKLNIQFNLDGPNFDTLVSEPDSEYSTLVNFNERSRGFKWFFSFYITFAADTEGGPAENAILLLDEPGLHLHATAQRDLLEHFESNFHNQIIYTTHSPFMVPIHDLAAVRTVNIEEGAGTTVTNDPTGDARTLFPLQAALGYDLTQTLFIGEKNLVVEGVTDFWYLSSVSDYLREAGGVSLPQDLTLTPAGGAQKVSYMVALLTAERLKVLVLLDDEQEAKNTADELIKAKLIREENVVFVSEGFAGAAPNGADVEDLLDPDVYATLVTETYAKELGAVVPTLNLHIPRIVNRYEQAFKDLGLSFNKSRPARLFLRRIAESPDTVLTPDSRQRFETLYNMIATRLQQNLLADRKPFV